MLAFETALAGATLTREEQQNFSNRNTQVSLDELADTYPLMDWRAYLTNLGIKGVDTLIVTDAGYFRELGGIVQNTPLETLKDALRLQLLRTYAGVLSEDLEAAEFEFSGEVLGGLEEQPPLEERVLKNTNLFLQDAVGRLYVEAAFSPEAKASATELIEEILSAFRTRLENVNWMTDATKERALDKLGKVAVKVGYPDTWETYEAVEVGDSYAETVVSAGQALLREKFSRAGQKVDRTEWHAPAQVVNAFYNPQLNEIVFPAGILQPPFFDPKADPASNFGALGYIVGHEITHGFDLQGSQFDAQGNLANWWSEEDAARFSALNGTLAEQYSQLEVLPGLFVNGQLTVTENAADLGGVQVAYDALQTHLAEHGNPGDIAGLSQNERFFIAVASAWRAKVRDAYLATYVQSNMHVPPSVRAVQPLKNADAFYEVFGTQKGDAMFLPPEERVVIW